MSLSRIYAPSIVAMALGVATGSSPASANQYFFHHLGVAGTVGGAYQPVVIGSVPLSGSIGTVLGSDDFTSRSFGWIGGVRIDRYFPNSSLSPTAISHNGAFAALLADQNAGNCYAVGEVAQMGFFPTQACSSIDPALISAGLMGVNDNGLAVGEAVRLARIGRGLPTAITTGMRVQCSLTNPCGSPDYLPTFGGGYSSAKAINNLNLIVGASTNSAGITRAFLMTPPGTTLRDFDPNDLSYNSAAVAINDGGTAAGTVDPGPCPQRLVGIGAYCKSSLAYQLPVSFHGKNGFTLLGKLGAVAGAALSINISGDIVGWGTLASGARHAFLYSSGIMTDLNSAILSGGSGWTLREANGINDFGQIVGRATGPAGQDEIFVLDPIPN